MSVATKIAAEQLAPLHLLARSVEFALSTKVSHTIMDRVIRIYGNGAGTLNRLRL